MQSFKFFIFDLREYSLESNVGKASSDQESTNGYTACASIRHLFTES